MPSSQPCLKPLRHPICWHHACRCPSMLPSAPVRFHRPGNLSSLPFKKGDATDTANYRPIAVGEPISRLYAGIWYSAWSSTQMSDNFDLPLKQAFGRTSAPSIKPLRCSTSLTSTGIPNSLSTSASWT
ncbi:hypothetical protein ABBQ32_14230 [Trebouxia sp. C0010 RCD-2024]